MSEKWKIGDIIQGQYEIHDIKKGGMGIVFLCYDRKNGNPIAIKTFQDKYKNSYAKTVADITPQKSVTSLSRPTLPEP